MKPTTGRLILDLIRNAKGMLTIFERWVRTESRIGSVSLGGGSGSASPSGSDGDSSGSDVEGSSSSQ